MAPGVTGGGIGGHGGEGGDGVIVRMPSGDEEDGHAVLPYVAVDHPPPVQLCGWGAQTPPPLPHQAQLGPL